MNFIFQFSKTISVSVVGIESESISSKFKNYPGIGSGMKYFLLRQYLIKLGMTASYFEVDILI
jgi:hypothetical protein